MKRPPYTLTGSSESWKADLRIALDRELGRTDQEIADRLNRGEYPGPYGARWSAEFVVWAELANFLAVPARRKGPLPDPSAKVR